MRNRTELVTTTLPGSENEEEASDLEDSEEDWKPAEKKKGAAGKPSKTSPKAAPKRKSSGAGAAAAAGAKSKKTPAKKVKKEESDNEDEDDDEEDYEEDEDEMDDDEEDEAPADGKGKKTKNATATKPARKGATNNIKSFPDKDGKFELYLFKDDLAKDFRNDPKLCMWRRDGSSLLQKYIKVKEEENKEDVIFAASSVYSCWEEKRKHDFFQIKVQCIGDKKDGKVKVVDVEELAKFAAEDRPKVEAKPADAAAAENEDEEEEGGDEEEEEEDGEEDEVEEEE